MSEASPWGMVVQTPSEHLLDLLNRGGVSWIRYEVPWSFVPRTGTPNWPAFGNTVMTAVRKRGMSVYLGLDLREPPWLYDGTVPAEQRLEVREESYERFIRSVMDYFGNDQLHGAGRVRYIHVGNEPNDPNFYPWGAEEYFERLRRAIQIIRANDGGRGFKVCAPDLAIERQYADRFLRGCIASLRQHSVMMIDVLSLHGYIATNGSALDLMLKLSPYTPLMKDLGLAAIPVWLTETGVNMTADVANNPRDITDLCNFVRNGFHVPWLGDLDLKKVFWYVWNEDDHAVAGVEGKYSWLTTDHVPRPREWGAYTAAINEPRPPVIAEYDAAITGPNIALRPGVQRAFSFRAVNTGRLAWGAGVRFENIDFNRQNPKLTPRSVSLPAPLPVASGTTCDVAIPVTAPDLPGVYRLRLQMTYNNGEQFGGRVVVSVTVVQPPWGGAANL